MTGEDLFDEGRAGTLQADDENWIARRVARAGVSVEQRPGEGRDGGLDARRKYHLPLRQLRRADAVASRIMAERAFGVVAIFKCLAERKMKVQRVLHFELALQGMAHRGNISRGESEALEVGKRPISFSVGRPRLDRLAKRRDRLIHAADSLQRIAEAHP